MDVADKMSERICLEQLQRGREARLICEVKSSNYIQVNITPMTYSINLLINYIISDLIFIFNIFHILDKFFKKINSLINYFPVHFP